jgi:hypothetical protein
MNGFYMPGFAAFPQGKLGKPVLDALPGGEFPARFGRVPQGACPVPLDGLLPCGIAARMFERRV